MKTILFGSLAAALLVITTQAWVLPQALQKAISVASMSAAVTLMSAAGPTTLIANAAVDFTGSYADPFHPNCQRVISVQGPEATLKGTDGNPACPADGSGNAWKLVGKVDGSTILVDFTPKGGPPGLKGVWDDSAPAGIKWPDGNKWTLKQN